ncbi:MAG: SDR family oxidoreductase [Ignavibacteria bacterium]|nr:SDR family oxidoreductase [Ignavibacteria bacterium]
MKILLTGVTGYIGKRLLPLLLEQGHEIVCCVRDKKRIPTEGIYADKRLTYFEVDFLKEIVIPPGVRSVDAAYYLIHSMTSDIRNFERLEETSANNFMNLVTALDTKRIIYLGGITNSSDLSKHLASRKKVEEILGSTSIPLTSIRAGIIVGSGSASFEIIRDLVEKLPVMVTPKWLNTKNQPIAIRNILECLTGVLDHPETENKSYDVGGPDILTYKQMLLKFAEVRGLRRYIYTVPVMTPRISSYWLYFVTATSYKLAVNLVNSMKIEVIARNNDLIELLGIKPIEYKEAVELAFQKIEQNNVLSSWKDSLVSSSEDSSLFDHINVPENGVFKDIREKVIEKDPDRVLRNIWSIGGERGWYYADFLWGIRGFLDKLVGGVGLRRGRTNLNTINTGDTLDFWRVLAADIAKKRLLLYAEMKLPGEAWLEFRILRKDGKDILLQTATYRPKGIFGRLYWYSVLPFHYFVFDGMAKNIVSYDL